jgi:HEAT repeat protein
MSESKSPQDDQNIGPRALPAGDDLLPPVEPPSAGFIIQLFVVPALIVLVIVSVWLTFTWLVRRTSPEAMVQGLEQGPSVARWQRASELADMLRNKRFAEFKQNAEAANQLARILKREIDQAGASDGMQEEQITLRYFLARALGEFEVPDGIGVLLKAAETNRHPSEQLVRNGALEAIAVRAYNLHRLDPPQELAHPDLYPALARLAADEDSRIRSQTAYALGQIGTPEAMKQLEALTDDPDPDTRYNAAVGLAHHGNAKAVETLAEMLDMEELTAMKAEADSQDSAFRQAVIVGNALEAVKTLAAKNTSADFSAVIESLEQLADVDREALKKAQLPSRVSSDARRVLESLQADEVGSRAL